MPSVTCVIPVLNGRAHVERAIASLQAQSVPVDVIVVDDGSSDGTADVVQAMHSSVQLVVTNGRIGSGAARNLGVGLARGEYVAFLDVDDAWDPSKLLAQIGLLESRPELAACGCGFRLIKGPQRRQVTFDPVRIESLDVLDFLAAPTLPTSTLVVRASIASRVAFAEGRAGGDDLIYLADVRRHGVVTSTREPLVDRYLHTAQVSKQGGHLAYSMRRRLNWLQQRAEELNLESKKARERIADEAVRGVWDYYWRGEFGEFVARRNDLRKTWPREFERPADLDRRTLPASIVSLYRWLFRFGAR